MKRCNKCHVAIIPDEVILEWERKWGTSQKPHYTDKCKICGEGYGEHFGTDCKNPVVYKCRHCNRCFEDVGDDYWIECPYCQAQNGHSIAIEGDDYMIKNRRRLKIKEQS